MAPPNLKSYDRVDQAKDAQTGEWLLDACGTAICRLESPRIRKAPRILGRSTHDRRLPFPPSSGVSRHVAPAVRMLQMHPTSLSRARVSVRQPSQPATAQLFESCSVERGRSSLRTMARHAARGAAGTALSVPSGFGGGPYSLCVQPSAPRPRTHVHGRATLPSDASMRSRCGQPGGRSTRRGAAVGAEDHVRTLAGGGGRAGGTAVTPRGAGAAVWGRADAAIRLN